MPIRQKRMPALAASSATGIAVDRVAAQERPKRMPRSRGHRLEQANREAMVAAEIVVGEDELADPELVELDDLLDKPIDRLVAA
jgi:hypothetical protein